MPDWKEKLLLLQNWIEGQGYKLKQQTDCEDAIVFNEKTISLNSRLHPETRLYYCLHECGHLLIELEQETFREQYISYVDRNSDKPPRSKRQAVGIIIEETEAWKRGKELAEELRLEIRKEKYEKIMTEALYTYMVWVI